MSGLDGVVVADTATSRIDGELGELVIAGWPVERLAATHDLAGVAALLWTGDLSRRDEVARALGAGRVAAHALLPSLGAALEAPDAMDALRAATGHLTPPAAEDPAGLAQVAAAPGVFLAAWLRRRAGEAPLAPDPDADHAADVVRLVRGAPDAARARALDAYWVTVVDHGFNASTFAARVVASTRSDAVSAVVAALGALKGPLHGGAPGPVLDMLDAVGRADPDLARRWVEGELAAGRRVMGMGHRVYRSRDPRARVLEAAARELGAAAPGARERLQLAACVEAAAEAVLAERYPGRPLKANVEFYTATLLEAIGLPREAFSATFACGRVVGWLAHVLEERAVGRLIRPRARYVGPEPATT
ncbi:MAG: citrate synthase [Planctomycetota bacterium]